MDDESQGWITRLRDPAHHHAAERELYDILLKAAFRESHRRAHTLPVGETELDDLAHQAADDAMVALLGKLETFRGESRFTTWAYSFVIFEVGNKFGRHYLRRHPTISLDAPAFGGSHAGETGFGSASESAWERLPARFGGDEGGSGSGGSGGSGTGVDSTADPLSHAQHRDLVEAVKRAVDETLSEQQRQTFLAIVVNGVPLEALSHHTGRSAGAIYKSVFDARRKIRAYLVTNGYVDSEHTLEERRES